MKPAFIILALLGLCVAQPVFAQQPTLDAEPPTTGYVAHPAAPSLSKTSDTEFVKSIRLQGALPTVFLFDNRFSGSSADSLLFWKSNTTTFTQSVAIDPPDYGVFTFDGRSSSGQPYSTLLLSGVADSLVSHLIALHPDTLYPNTAGAPRAVLPQDSLYLTFFYQAGGRGDFPEVGDSLILYFRDSTRTGPIRWIPVWAMSSFDLNNIAIAADTFYQAIVPVADPRFFHERFQFKFQNKANLNGQYDLWHVDRIFLYSGASFANPFLFRDIGISGVTRRIRGVYTQLPTESVPLVADQVVFSSRLFNLSNFDATGIPVTFSGTDLIGGGLLTEPTQTVAILQREGQTVTLPIAPMPALGSDSARVRFRVATTTGTFNQIANNDVLDFIVPLDSVLAVDDGEADSGFGLNTTFRQQFGQRFVLPSPPDTLQAVWMSFLPRYNMPSGKGCELIVWDAKAYHPDSILYRQLINADQGQVPNHFARFILESPFVLPDSFIVGVRQFDNVPINLGVDKDFDYNNNRNIVYDNLGQWLVAPFEGTLMIRLELSGKNFPVTARAARISSPALRIYPNPSTHGQLSIDGATAHLPSGALELQIQDAVGRTVVDRKLDRVSFPYTEPSAAHLTSGIYTVGVRVHAAPMQYYKWIRP
jgi:hypothetical protein